MTVLINSVLNVNEHDPTHLIITNFLRYPILFIQVMKMNRRMMLVLLIVMMLLRTAKKVGAGDIYWLKKAKAFCIF